MQLQTSAPQHRQTQRTRKGDPTSAPQAPKKKPRPGVSKAQRLRHLLAMLDFLAATEPFFQYEFARCAAAVRLKAMRTPEGDLRTVLEALAEGGMTVDELTEETGLPYNTAYSILQRLEVAWLVGHTRLRNTEERIGKRGGPSKRLVYWLRSQNPQVLRVRKRADKKKHVE